MAQTGQTLQERIAAALGTVVNPRTGENIVVRRFARFQMGEA